MIVYRNMDLISSEGVRIKETMLSSQQAWQIVYMKIIKTSGGNGGTLPFKKTIASWLFSVFLALCILRPVLKKVDGFECTSGQQLVLISSFDYYRCNPDELDTKLYSDENIMSSVNEESLDYVCVY